MTTEWAAPGRECLFTGVFLPSPRPEDPTEGGGCVGREVWNGDGSLSKVPSNPVAVGWEFQAPWKEVVPGLTPG